MLKFKHLKLKVCFTNYYFIPTKIYSCWVCCPVMQSMSSFWKLSNIRPKIYLAFYPGSLWTILPAKKKVPREKDKINVLIFFFIEVSATKFLEMSRILRKRLPLYFFLKGKNDSRGRAIRRCIYINVGARWFFPLK